MTVSYSATTRFKKDNQRGEGSTPAEAIASLKTNLGARRCSPVIRVQLCRTEIMGGQAYTLYKPGRDPYVDVPAKMAGEGVNAMFAGAE